MLSSFRMRWDLMANPTPASHRSSKRKESAATASFSELAYVREACFAQCSNVDFVACKFSSHKGCFSLVFQTELYRAGYIIPGR